MRSLLQFRLRTLFAGVTILAIPCAWFGGQLRGLQADLQALAELQPTRVTVEDASRAPIPILT